MRNGFHLGKVGWCGGGIYFAMSPEATQGKALLDSRCRDVKIESKMLRIGPDSHKGLASRGEKGSQVPGFMIEAQVRVGNAAHGDRKCKMNGWGCLRSWKTLENHGRCQGFTLVLPWLTIV